MRGFWLILMLGLAVAPSAIADACSLLDQALANLNRGAYADAIPLFSDALADTGVTAEEELRSDLCQTRRSLSWRQAV